MAGVGVGKAMWVAMVLVKAGGAGAEPPVRVAGPSAAREAPNAGAPEAAAMACTCLPVGGAAPAKGDELPLSCTCIPAARQALPAAAPGPEPRVLPASVVLSGDPSPPPGIARGAEPHALLEAKGRFLGRIESDESDDYGRRYGVQQARLGLAYRDGPIRAEVEADLAETRVLNDAWFEYRAEEWGRGRIGRFKAPFSEFLLASAWERPVLRRSGLPKAVRDLGFGGRDVGAQLAYKAKSLGRLEVEAGVFEGAAIGAAAAAEDGYARVTAAPWKPLRFGVSAGRRAVFDRGNGDAFGLDARLLVGGVTARVEGLIAENGTTGATVDGAIGHVAYRFPIGAGWLEPAIEAELARYDEGAPRNGLAATIGAGVGERFLLRGGVERGPTDPTGPATTALLFQAGVQL